MHKPPLTFLVAPLTAVLLVCSAQAQPEQPVRPAPPASATPPAPAAPSEPSDEVRIEPAPGPEASSSALTFELRPRFEYTFQSSLDDADADVSVGRASVGLDMAYPIDPRFKLVLNTDLEASAYSFDSGPSAGFFDDPYDDVYRVRLSPGFFYVINQKWAVLGGGIVELSGESDADVGDSATYGGYAGARYAFSEKFSLTGGVSVKTRIEDNLLFIPIIGFEWKVSSRVTLSTFGPGFGVRLNAALNEAWSFSLAASWETRDYRLAEDASIPEGIARDERVPVIAGFTWKPRPTISLTVFGGAVVWQELSLDDSDGDELAEDNTDPAGLAGISASFRF